VKTGITEFNPTAIAEDEAEKSESPCKILIRDTEASQPIPMYQKKTHASMQKTKTKKNYES
jgi:hypothetical protein